MKQKVETENRTGKQKQKMDITKSLSTLRRSRGGYKTRLNVVETKIFETEKAGQIDQNFIDYNINLIDDLMIKVIDVQQQIEEMVSDEEFVEEVQKLTEIQKIHEKLSLMLCRHRMNLNVNYKLTESGRQEFRQENVIGVKLPELKLPVFSGEITEWLQFSDSFESLVIQNRSLTEIQKLQYLKSCLRGNALTEVANISTCERNFMVAWNLLRERYQNTKLVLRGYIEQIVCVNFDSKKSGINLRQALIQLKNSVQALKSLGYETNELCEQIIIYQAECKLDTYLKDKWLEFTDNQKPPQLEEFLLFLEKYCQILENKSSNSATDNTYSPHKFTNSKSKTHFLKPAYVSGHGMTCVNCGEDHSIYFCSSFQNLNVDCRYGKAKELNLCYNCLKVGHNREKCFSKLNCKTCGERHNTLLHTDRDITNSDSGIQDVQALTAGICKQPKQGQVMLPTAIVMVKGHQGKCIPARVLLDSGSELNFISEALVQHLTLKRCRKSYLLSGIGNKSLRANSVVRCEVQSRLSDYKLEGEFVVLKKITQNIPLVSIFWDASMLPCDKSLLADPKFYQSQKIDMLFGCEIFLALLKENKINNPGGIIWLESELGWICAGRAEQEISQPEDNTVHGALHVINQEENLEEQLTKFWKVDEFEDSAFTSDSQENLNCLSIFKKTVTRNFEGRYVVSIPFKEFKLNKLGDSRQLAERHFLKMERRLENNDSIKQQYKNFMSEYLELGHMEKLDSSDCLPEVNFFLPHHPVIREESLTTKLRVVFNASARSSSGLSLNDCQYIGPRVQQELFSILLRARMHKIFICADVEKMYRQILINPDQRNFQLILWRDSSMEPIQVYRLNTVTYGTSSAPFLATQTLIQLTEDEKMSYPVASRIAQTDFYMDDLITGCEGITEGQNLVTEMIKMFESAGMSLRKWCSNSKEVLNSIPRFKNGHCGIIDFSEEDDLKTLGLIWNPSKDSFQFKSNKILDQRKTDMSKRKILSEISKLFDPLGLVTPIITSAKVLMQSLWQCKLSWDERISDELEEQWKLFIMNLSDLDKISIPRLVVDGLENLELHVFTDASEKAYGVCVYIKSNKLVSLLCSKSRVAPLKSLSIPRLELCGAALAVTMINKITPCLQVNISDVHYWTDSEIVLHWIKSESRQWKSFVANRVGEIQRYSNPKNWHFVPTSDNPADLISRGAAATTLQKSNVWWCGPKILMEPKNKWGLDEVNSYEKPTDNLIYMEKKKTVISLSVVEVSEPFWQNVISRFSSFKKLQKVFAYVLRFIDKCRKVNRMDVLLSIEELDRSHNIICKIVQESQFTKEIMQLKNKGSVSKKSPIASLHPFLDEFGVLRVGGRLNHTDLSFDQKHPIILPSSHFVTQLIVEQEHIRCLHGGVSIVLYHLRLKYWPLHGRSTVKRILKKCIICFKANPMPAHQLMGSLPRNRVSPGRPFLRTAVDYGGPVFIRSSMLRKAPTLKAYICLFVCMTTKAVHLELVTDLSTETFIAALRRLISRRGKCIEIYSDNGSNFVGANNVLKELKELFTKETFKSRFNEFIQTEHILWKFIPPNSPHMGGLWEAGIKSTKYHLRRMTGEQKFTYEQYTTLLVQIEAVLNSRPLYANSDDPNDFAPLTPGHFLIGSSFQTFPDRNYLDKNPWTLSNHYRHLQHLYQQFWQKWSLEYLNNLQQRNKWKFETPNQIIGSLVVVVEDSMPPLHWKMARIIECLASEDGLIRVVNLRFPNGSEGKRAVAKICLLPIEGNENMLEPSTDSNGGEC